MREDGVGHVLVEEGCLADEIECHPIWTYATILVSIFSSNVVGVYLGLSLKSRWQVGSPIYTAYAHFHSI